MSTLSNGCLCGRVSVGMHQVDGLDSNVEHQAIHQGNVVSASRFQLGHLADLGVKEESGNKFRKTYCLHDKYKLLDAVHRNDRTKYLKIKLVELKTIPRTISPCPPTTRDISSAGALRCL